MSDYLEFAKLLALEAGEIMQKNFIIGDKPEWKDDLTPLTITDTKINNLIIERISKKYPDHSVWGEEQHHNLGNKFTWVCDPVDGTMPFSHGMPISTFSLALTQDGKPILGVVYDPYMKRMFWALEGRGSFMNDQTIQVSATDSLENTLIDLEGFPGTKPVLEVDSRFINIANKVGAQTTVHWSVILPSVLVASGKYTAAIFNNPKPEDGAAVKIIVEEAGGKVTDLFGNEQRYDGPIKGFIASNGKVHQQLVDLLSKYKVV